MKIPEQLQQNQTQYEHIPRYEELLSPNTDRQAHHYSKPVKHSLKHSSDSSILNSQLQALRHKIEVLKGQLTLEREKNQQLEAGNILQQSAIKKIENLMRKFGQYQEDYHIDVTNLFIQLELLLQKHNTQHFQNLLSQKQQLIADLRSKLLSSTQNNINSIFKTELTSQQYLERQFEQMKKQINALQQVHLKKESSIKEEVLLRLVKNYEDLIREYRNKEEILKILQNGQNNTNLHFQQLRQHLVQTIELTCLSKHSKKIQQLQQRLLNTLDGNTPEQLKPEYEDQMTERDIFAELNTLHKTISSQQVEINNLKAYNIRLEEEIHQIWANSIESQRSSILQEKCKQKDKRIFQLQNTIIDHLGEKAKDAGLRISNISSSNSAEDAEQKLRNYKTIIKSLKKQISNLKSQIRIITSPCSNNLTSQERASQDQLVIALVEQILQVFITIKRKNYDHCSCLEQLVDILLQKKSVYPELEELLINYGFIQTSSNLISMNYNELTI